MRLFVSIWLALASATAGGETRPMVVIEHRPLESFPAGSAVTVKARMVSRTGQKIFEPAVFARPRGATDFLRIPMLPLQTAPEVFQASLPPELTRRDLDYFLETFDEEGNGPFRKGTPEAPLQASAILRAPPPLPAEAMPTVATTRAITPAESSGRQTAGLVVVGAGGALVLGGAISGILALGDYNAEKSASTGGDLARYSTARSAAENESLAADLLIGAGVIAAAVGAYLLLTDDRSPLPVGQAERRARVTVGASPIRGGAVAVVGGEF